MPEKGYLERWGNARRTAWGNAEPAYNVNLTKTGSARIEKVDWRHSTMYFDAIAKIVSERTGCDVSAVKPESKFSELGIDSLDTVELLMSLEDEIGMEIELDQKGRDHRRSGPLSSRASRAENMIRSEICDAHRHRIPGVSGAAWPGSLTASWPPLFQTAAASASLPPATRRGTYVREQIRQWPAL